MSGYVQASLEQLGPDYSKRAKNLWFCAKSSEGTEYLTKEGVTKMQVTGMHFCRERLCPVCQGMKSRKMGYDVGRVFAEYKNRHKSDKPLLLTLTLRNCEYSDLRKTLDHLSDGFRKLRQREEFKGAVRGWFSAKEVTINTGRREFHPHMHVLLMVPKAYFDKSRNLYIGHADWVRIWQECLGVDYRPLVGITSVEAQVGKLNRNGKAMTEEGAIEEVTKYVVKPGDYLQTTVNGAKWADPELMKYLHQGLHRVRLTAFGGEFKLIAKELDIKSAEDDTAELLPEAKLPEGAIPVARVLMEWRLGAKLDDADYVEVLRDERPQRRRKAA